MNKTYTPEEYRQRINEFLGSAICADKAYGYDELAESMNYSLLAGGKRIRPILVLEFCRLCGGNVEEAFPIAAAIEMVHTYSLIHDDLPCMDNDDLRRGRKTNHKVYGECTATLAGDALQACAFETALKSGLPADRKASCALILAEAAGLNGMCGGQYMDMAWEGKELSVEELDRINSCKTGAMIKAACRMGVAAAGGDAGQMAAAEKFGEYIGLAFQIRDDILDAVSTEAELGKPIGSDAEENKNTYMHLLGEKRCTEIVEELTEKAVELVRNTFEDAGLLTSLAQSLAGRRN